MTEQGKEVTKIKEQTVSPAEMIATVLEKGGNLDNLEKFIELQERHDSNEAKKSFAKALVEVQGKIPVIKKTRENKQTRSMYADLSDIVKVITPIYTNGGFSMTFYEGETSKPDHVRVCADVQHELGHEKTYHYDAPMDGKGLAGKVNMTQTHAKATTVQYAKRYLMCMVWNIPTGDDTDGCTNTLVEIISEKELSQLCDLLTDANAKASFILKNCGIESLELLPKSKLEQVKKQIALKKIANQAK